jgi:cell division protein FtsB
MHNIRLLSLSVPVLLMAMFFSQKVHAVTLEELAEQVQALAAENAELRKKIDKLEAATESKPAEEPATKVADIQAPVEKAESKTGMSGVVQVSHEHSYQMLDPTTKINRKQELLLQAKQNGSVEDNTVILGGAVTAIADYAKSNTEDKFGYLMRHPTANNQRTDTSSEAVVHSAQLSLTGSMGDWVTAHFEALYDPEQSFGAGTNTSIDRNQVQMRKAYVLFGNLDKSPFYVSLGKMATPFGLTDTPNPFTGSTVWHAFGGLAYGLKGGYVNNGLSLRAMAIQGGAQFRAHNVPVDDSSVPSKLNNYALDASYTFGGHTMVGASYTRGSAYCQDFPITHFTECTDNNPAYDVYLQSHFGNLMLMAEFAKTTDVWPGTFNPTIPQYAASKVTSWDIGGRYALDMFGRPGYLSADFSRFIAGPDGSPWENQDQLVLGVSSFLTSSVKLFGEYIHTEGYAPLNFISGGNLDDGETHSDRDAKSNMVLFGVNAAF